MKFPLHFTRDLLYIEPLLDRDFMCQAVYSHSVTQCTKTTERWIDEYLTFYYSTNLKATRNHARLNYGMTRMSPILIDLNYRFILFPLNATKNKNVYYINLSKLYKCEATTDGTNLMFLDGHILYVPFPFRQCENQYVKATLLYDRASKFKELRDIYLENKTVRTMYNITKD